MSLLIPGVSTDSSPAGRALPGPSPDKFTLRSLDTGGAGWTRMIQLTDDAPGDRTQEVMKLSPISLMPGAEEQGHQWIEVHPDQTADRIDAVLRLITGFASAYGLELLATVHWVLTHDGDGPAADPDALMRQVATRNERKGRLFTEVHICRAADRLRDLGWVPAAQSAPCG